MTLGQRFARFTTDVVVRWPVAWRMLRRPVTRMFDRLAPDWGTRRSPDWLAGFDLALDAIAPTPERVLDVGAGTGGPTVAVARRWPEAEVVGVDVSPGMIAEALARLPADVSNRVRYQVADAESLPFPDGTFDVVTMVNMIPFFDELARVVKPGGCVVVFASSGSATPIYVSPSRLRRGFAARGFMDFAEFAAGSGTALLAHKPYRS